MKLEIFGGEEGIEVGGFARSTEIVDGGKLKKVAELGNHWWNCRRWLPKVGQATCGLSEGRQKIRQWPQ